MKTLHENTKPLEKSRKSGENVEKSTRKVGECTASASERTSPLKILKFVNEQRILSAALEWKTQFLTKLVAKYEKF